MSLKDAVKALPLVTELARVSGLWLVGGAIRDYLVRGKLPAELDFICLDIEAVKKKLEEYRVSFFQLGEKFRTCRAFLGSLQVDFSPLDHQDLYLNILSRDFTCNALAFDIRGEQLVDLVGGVEDIRNKVLRFINGVESFSSDPVRILRAARFGPGQGFSVSDSILKEISNSKSLLKEVKSERVGQEFYKLLVCDHVADALVFCNKEGILTEIIDWWAECVDFLQNEFHVEDVASHSLTVLRRAEILAYDHKLEKDEKFILLCSALLHDIAKPRTFLLDRSNRRRFFNHEILGARYVSELLAGWSLAQELVQKVCILIKFHMRPLDCGKAGVRRLKRDLAELFHLWRLLKIADKPPVMTDIDFLKQLHEFDTLCLSVEPVPKPKFEFNGNDLKDFGLKEGPSLGRVLNSFRFKALECPECNDKQFVKKLVSRFVW